MTDWKMVAAALAPDIPAEALDKATGPLKPLEESFARALAQFDNTADSAVIFDAAPGDAE